MRTSQYAEGAGPHACPFFLSTLLTMMQPRTYVKIVSRDLPEIEDNVKDTVLRVRDEIRAEFEPIAIEGTLSVAYMQMFKLPETTKLMFEVRYDKMRKTIG